MMQGCGNEIFSIFNRFHRLKISSILPGVSSVEMGTLKTIEHCRKEKEMATKETDAKEPDSKSIDAKVTVSKWYVICVWQHRRCPGHFVPWKRKNMLNVWCVRVTGGMFM